MQILNKKAQNNNFWNIFSVFDKFQPSPLIFLGVTSVTSFVVDDPWKYQKWGKYHVLTATQTLVRMKTEMQN